MPSLINTDRAANERAAEKTGATFFVFAAFEVLLILGGALLTFLVAPASLFVSSTESEALWWIAAGLSGFVALALGVILLPLAVVSGAASRHGKRWGKTVGIITLVVSLLQIPFGTIFGVCFLWKISRSARKEASGRKAKLTNHEF